MKLTLPYPPSLNRMYRMVNNRWLTSAVGRAYKTEVDALCLVSKVRPIEGEIRVVIDIYRPAKRGDLDNFFKGLFDSLNGNVWYDDSQVVAITARRFDDKDNPRVEVEIEAI